MLEFEKDIWRSQNDTPPVAAKIGTPALLEQLGEECAELGKAALKEARRLRGENPTPVTEAEARANLAEEAADVLNCLVELSRIYFDVDQYGTTISIPQSWKFLIFTPDSYFVDIRHRAQKCSMIQVVHRWIIPIE